MVLLAVWCFLYWIVDYVVRFKRLSEKESNDVKNRIVSIVHGSVSFGLAATQYLPYPVFKYVLLYNP